jgi:hypothetical protein
MMPALVADLEVVFDLALEKHLFATRALQKQTFGANGSLLRRIGRLRLISFSKPAHN